eukprot:CAMPEP_0113851798 /NCGR_PEP_ID=MMETSP0372-20130328/4931_1 /TAXON_ID=340204 /ORGANISM="Lankesteria abbotti" /LENGTH=212 /DNA_ID=CAMNT_0000822829 /DNA_START=123 /DNA_END=758 /DNA_ORIENTATION=- /assembly_acc=CAM_ASM_000359
MELRLGNIDRCRLIFAKFVEIHPRNPNSWIALVDLETTAEEIERVRSVCETALDIDVADFPELIWKAYIDAEVNNGDIARARQLFERLLERTQHSKVFKSYADFEVKDGESMIRCRSVIQRGLTTCRESEWEEERKNLLEHWLKLEVENGDEAMIQKVWMKQPKKVKKKRNIVGSDGTSHGWEEYTAYIFPEDVTQTSNLKILEAAKKWKRT